MPPLNRDTGTSDLLFSGFLAVLRRQGFIIGVDHYLRLQEVLNSLSPGCRPGDIKYLVCPLFATNEKQQRQFYRAFDAYFKPLGTAAAAPKPAPGKAEEGETAEPPGEAVTPPQWQYILLGILLLILALLLIYRLGEGPGEKIGPRETRAAVQPGVGDKPGGKEGRGDEPGIGTPGLPPGQGTGKPGETGKSRPFWQKYRYIFQWLGLLAPFIILLLMEGYKYNRRRLFLVKQRGKKPPFVWPVTVETPGTNLVKNERFYQAARFLRQRLASDIDCLDLDKTLCTTIEKAGFPGFCYKPLTRPPEYLILIDLPGYRDHYARLCDSMVTALENEGLFVNRYFYERDPRVCFKEPEGERVYLSDLKTRYGEHRLLIFADGDELLDPLSGELDKWTGLFRAWPQRAVLTPRPPQQWGLREIVLAKEFILLPASCEGLCALRDHFEMTMEPGLKTWKQADAKLPLLSPGMEDNIDGLREYLGKATFQWLCACAVYPELHWDLTLYLGSLPCMPGNLISEENVLRLIRLPWFRTGTMPDELRWELIGRLDNDKSQAIRTAIIELLEKNPAPPGSFAYDTYRLHLVVQRWMLSRRDRQKRKEMLKSLKLTVEKRFSQDYTLLRFLESAPKSPLHFVLPKRLQKLFYRNGVPWFGFKTGIRVALTVLMAAAFFLFFKGPHAGFKTGHLILLALPVLTAVALFLFTKDPTRDKPPEVRPDAAKEEEVDVDEKGFRERDIGAGIVMVYIPPGEFTMGSNDYNDEKPPHQVYLDGYWLGKTEVTFAQYDKYCEETGKEKPGDRGWGRKDRPVINVSWDDAAAYCKWLSNKTGLKFKLPTEAQWEKAARGNDGRKYPWGDREPGETLANFGGKIGKTTPVGAYPDGASPYGLLDMAGNVWEWCSDWYDPKYYKNTPKENPPGPKNGPDRVIRGGGWYSDARGLRCADRYSYVPSNRYNSFGFRLCQDIK